MRLRHACYALLLKGCHPDFGYVYPVALASPVDDGREKALSGTSAEQEAYRHILDGIRSGRFGPGDRLIAEALATELGMSRMPVREAIQRLSSEGLLVTRPNRGSTVPGLTVDEIAEIFEIRSVLEGLAARLAAPQIDRAARTELDALQRAMRISERAEDGAWTAHHVRLHSFIASLSRRPKLIRQIDTLMLATEPYLRIYRNHVRKSRSADEAHRILLDIVKRGDAESSEAAMRQHILGTLPLLCSFLAEVKAPKPAGPRTRAKVADG